MKNNDVHDFSSFGAPRRSKTAPERSKTAPRRAKSAPRGSKSSPRRAKSAPRPLQDRSKTLQERSKTAPRRDKTLQDAPRAVQEAPRGPQAAQRTVKRARAARERRPQAIAKASWVNQRSAIGNTTCNTVAGLDHRGANACTRTQLPPSRVHRFYRKSASTTVKPAASRGKQLAPRLSYQHTQELSWNHR